MKREGVFLTILTYLLPAIGLVATSILWALGYIGK